MGIAAAIIGAIAIITTALGVLTIIEVPAEPILSAKLTWSFWFSCSVILLLGSIALILGNRNNGD
jgi:hypothetical protein